MYNTLTNHRRAHHDWQTFHELAFLDGLSTWSTQRHNPHTLLRQYARAMSRRRDWGSVNVAAVVAHVRELLTARG